MPARGEKSFRGGASDAGTPGSPGKTSPSGAPGKTCDCSPTTRVCNWLNFSSHGQDAVPAHAVIYRQPARRRDALRVRNGASFKQPPQLHTLPLTFAQQGNHIRHGVDPSDQKFAGDVDIGTVAQRPRHDRLDHSEDVLEPVIELVIVHVHAIATTGWLLTASAMVLMVETGKVGLHRRVGWFAAGYAALVIVIAPWSELSWQALNL